MAERTARTHVSNILAKLGLAEPDAGGAVRRRAPAGRDVVTGAVAAAGSIVVGPPGAPAIVFVHGTRLTGSLWAAQQAALGGRVPDDRPGPAGARRPGRRAVHARRRRGRASRRRSAPRRRTAGRSWSGCRWAAMSRWPSPPASPDSSAGWSSRARRAEPVGPAIARLPALADVMDGVADERLDRLNAWFFRRRYPPEIAEPIIAGGFWSHGGAEAVRASSASGSSRAWPPIPARA